MAVTNQPPQAFITQTQFDKLMDQVSAMQSSNDRLIPAVESLTLIASDLRNIINAVTQDQAVVKNRLDFQEKFLEKMQDHVEKRRSESDMEVKAVYGKLEGIEKSAKSYSDETYEELINKIETLTKAQTALETATNNKIGKIEKWMWTAAGGGTLLLWLAQNYLIPIITGH